MEGKMTSQIIRIDDIKWWVTLSTQSQRLPVPICPEHNLRMEPQPSPRGYRSNGAKMYGLIKDAKKLECAEGPHVFDIPRTYEKEQKYILDRIDAKTFQNMPVLNLDDEAVPISKDKTKSGDGKYFATAQIMESKRGVQLVVYAGEKGKKEKTQIFVEPEVKRLAFDQNNLNPDEVFTKLKATFDDGSSHEIKKGKIDE